VADSNSNGVVQSINNNNGRENGLQSSTKEEQHLSTLNLCVLSIKHISEIEILSP